MAGDVHLRAVVTLVCISNGHGTSALCQEPNDVVTAALALRLCASHESKHADVLQDATRSSSQLLPGCAFFAQCIAELVVFEEHAVSVEAAQAACLLAQTTCEHAGLLILNGTHDLELGSTTWTFGPADEELLAEAISSAASPFVMARLGHEEHQHTPLLFHAAKRSSTSTGDIADAVRRHLHDGAVFAILPIVDVHWALKLHKEPLHVLPGTPPLRPFARKDRGVPHVLHNCA
mmetsp:Transcript_43569/g.100781  ORF Transcript_43569/g.100781 Transcript_43569/m.100781 type:complete len:234 (-) Transcript_43569:799-1500(-)